MISFIFIIYLCCHYDYVKELNVSKMQELDITRILIYNRGTSSLVQIQQFKQKITFIKFTLRLLVNFKHICCLMKKSKLFYEVVKSKMSFPAEILDKLFCSYEPEPHVVGLLELEPHKKRNRKKYASPALWRWKSWENFLKISEKSRGILSNQNDSITLKKNFKLEIYSTI